MPVPGTRRLCRFGLAAVLVTAIYALAFVDLPPQLQEPLPDPPSTLGGEPPGTQSVVAYSWARRLALDYRPSTDCPTGPSLSLRGLPSPSASPNWLETLDGQLFLFSAHLDQRVTAYPNLRVIAVRSRPLENLIYCTVWLDEDGQLRTVSMEALVSDIWLDQWGGVSETYTGVLITCPLPRNSSPRPIRVTVVGSACAGEVSQSVGVRLREEREKDRGRRFTVCVKGLDFEEDVSAKLVSFVELNRILGAERIYFYVFHVHENVLRALRVFERSNVVRWANLTLPGSLPNEVEHRRRLLEGDVWLKRRLELVPYNHCFYDSLQEADFVVPLDLDEAIVPAHVDSWARLIEDEEKRLGAAFRDFASYAVRNAYFFTELQPASPRSGAPYLDTRRAGAVSPEGDAVKSFVSTRRALTVHNHYALDTLRPATRRAHHFSPCDVLKHHHRLCDDRHLDCDSLMRDVTTDYSATRFASELVNRTETILGYLNML
ncbi:uncharacterized protein LOC107225102 [Neodiprion lecontei]|uniref:Glycosyltransferase family 92 protein n=1 Tax=Neodiprion lecontei TaxID=441921 RepID=A0A6J0C337_NEOLC|nr:uncharacterized protein LOC107225102 [Neodiprion lecontei]XP_046601229.1 uncharacterized protein LOC107225102 [Neodiprion lecontei]